MHLSHPGTTQIRSCLVHFVKYQGKQRLKNKKKNIKVPTLPPDQEEALDWQRHSEPGAEKDSWSCVGMVRTGTGRRACWAETVQRESRERFLVLFILIEQDQELE